MCTLMRVAAKDPEVDKLLAEVRSLREPQFGLREPHPPRPRPTSGGTESRSMAETILGSQRPEGVRRCAAREWLSLDDENELK
jgi:hypothetical protein